MNRNVARVAALATLLSLLPAARASADHSRLDDTRREIRATRARLAGALREDAGVMRALRAVSGQLMLQRARLAAARAHLGRIDLAIRNEERRLARLATEADSRRAIIGARARALYILGPQSGFAETASVEDYMGGLGIVDFVARADRVVLEDLATIADEARKARAALVAKRIEAIAARDEVATRVALVSEVVHARATLHGRLRGVIADERAELAALEREQERILRLIDSRGSRGDGRVGRYGLTWPIRGRITSRYGPRWGRFHTGIDIDCRTGDRIGASKGGRIIAAEWGGGYGRMVIVDHGDGLSTVYAHLSRIWVREGQGVSTQQGVGACGATGNATGDHLHFEVRVNGRHRDPMDYLP